MKSKIEIKRFMLQAVSRFDGEPIPEIALIQSTQLAFCHDTHTLDDLKAIIAELESERYITGTVDQFTEQKLWTLTPKGQIQARG